MAEKQLLNKCYRSINNTIQVCKFQRNKWSSWLANVLDDEVLREYKVLMKRIKELTTKDGRIQFNRLCQKYYKDDCSNNNQ